MVTQKQFKEHWLNLFNQGAIYVWGGNGEIITKELTDKLYRLYGSAKYNKAYYDAKCKEGEGKMGADCSGAIFPLSKNDMGAKAYYQYCEIKGTINNLPKDTACLIFSEGFTHVGAYMGDGTTIEMMNSQKNVQKQTFNKSRWAYYGIPKWLENDIIPNSSIQVRPININIKIIKNIQKWCNEYCNANLIIDGKYGSKTKSGLCKALQHCLNVKYNAELIEDGKFGQKTKEKCKKASDEKELTYICQAMLYCKDYDMNHSIKNDNLDGVYGKGTKEKVFEYQQDTRGLLHDGICGPATFYSMFN